MDGRKGDREEAEEGNGRRENENTKERKRKRSRVLEEEDEEEPEGRTKDSQRRSLPQTPKSRLISSFYPKADVLIFQFDISRPSSMNSLRTKYLPEVRKDWRNAKPIILVGNKVDRIPPLPFLPPIPPH